MYADMLLLSGTIHVRYFTNVTRVQCFNLLLLQNASTPKCFFYSKVLLLQNAFTPKCFYFKMLLLQNAHTPKYIFSSGLYYKDMAIVNDDSSVISEQSF
jgi:hypothetical protein